MMDYLRAYQYLIRARVPLLDRVRLLSGDEYGRGFAIGCGSVARTLAHVASAEWYYALRLTGQAVPAYDTWTINEERPPVFEVLESFWTTQGEATRRIFDGMTDWHAEVVYRVQSDEGHEDEVVATAGDIATQLVLHEVHHRAQMMNMLRQLGKPVEEIDFNTLMYTRRRVGAE